MSKYDADIDFGKLPAAKLAACHPKLTCGVVWCMKCGKSQKVNSEECFINGWPECCSQTMTIDSPEERKILNEEGK